MVNHRIQFKIHEVLVSGSPIQLGLFYSAFVNNSICETVGSPRRAWRRSGLQNLELSDGEIEALKRDKGVVSFERTHCAPFDETDVDTDVYKEFLGTRVDNESYNSTTTDLLKAIGAIVKGALRQLAFPNVYHYIIVFCIVIKEKVWQKRY